MELDERSHGIFRKILETLEKILKVETENKNCNCASLEVLRRIEKQQTPKLKSIKVKYDHWISLIITKEKKEMSTVVVPVGPNTATIQVLDTNGSDVTGSCTITAVSSDPTVLAIGNPDATEPNVIPFTAVTAGGSVTVDYEASNEAGNVVQTDTIQIEVSSPASMLITYGATLPQAPQQVKDRPTQKPAPVGAKR